MLSRERVIETIEHRKPDRVPIYGWVRANLDAQITQAFGSCDAFEDKYEFDFAHVFGGPATFNSEALQKARVENGGIIDPPALLDVPMTDPNVASDYQSIADQVRHHKEQRGRFVYVQTPGFFEAMNGAFGIENHLAYLLMYPDEIKEIYARQARWTLEFANNCLDLGCDMVHVSDDWGAQWGLLFSPKVWWEMIFPYHKQVTDAVRKRGAYVSLHTDGNNMQVLDGIVELGYDVLHPFQVSAGMDLDLYRSRYMGTFVVMGGLDVQTTIGFGNFDRLRDEITGILTTFRDGGLLFCTTHFVQDHCTIEELTYAYDLVYGLVRELA